MNSQRIIMNYARPPASEEIESLVQTAIQSLPHELSQLCEKLAIRVDDWPDETLEQEMDLMSPYDLLALYKSGKELAPGIVKKTANDDDILIVFRRPLLDFWCESGDDLIDVVRHTLIEELGRHFEFSDEDIEDFARRSMTGSL